jgi:hypothetical protein
MPAHAQATRTWVSGTGDDGNQCSRAAPCLTFAGAIGKTAAFGEINCLDPGGFGAVVITKSIAINCDGVPAGILVSGSNGIVVNVATTDTVLLRGLNIDGITTGLSGITFLGGGTLHLDKCLIRLFNSSSAGFGINFTPNDAASLTIRDSVIASNRSGILLTPAASGSINATFDHVTIANNNGGGIKADSSNGPIDLDIADSTISGNAGNGLNVTNGTGVQNNAVSISRTTIAKNGVAGIQVGGGNAAVLLDTTLLDSNVNGATEVLNGGRIVSDGTNRTVGPAGSGFTSTVTLH